jgi:hypothetical protein
MGDERSLEDALHQALQIEAAKPPAGSPARLREMTRAPVGTIRQKARNARMDGRYDGNVGKPHTSAENIGGRMKKTTRMRETSKILHKGSNADVVTLTPLV